MIRSRRHYVTAWLALSAMLMIFIAPVISQSLAMTRATTIDAASLPQHHHGESGNSLSAQGQSPHGAHAVSAHKADSEPAPADHSGHLGKCGYCTLMAQLPALAGSTAGVMNASVSRAEPVQGGAPNARAIKAIFPNALSRAPPPAGSDIKSLPGA